MNNLHELLLLAAALIPASALAQSFNPVSAFDLAKSDLVISRPVQPAQPFTVAGPRGVLVGTQDGQFESWILPVKLLSHLTIEADIEGYTVPIAVNPQAANIEVRPDHTTITYSHPGFTLRQIMFSPQDDEDPRLKELGVVSHLTSGKPSTGPIVLFQIDALHPTDFIFRFTPEMRWMWPKRNDGIPSPEWVPLHPVPSLTGEDPPATGPGFYILHMDYPDLAGAITIPGAEPGIMAPYQERPQVHPLELRLHYDPKRDGNKFFPLLMAVGTTGESSSTASLRHALETLNASVASTYAAHAESYRKLLAETTSIETPDKALNQAFQWGVVSIEQLKALEYPGPASPPGATTPETALVAGYYQSADSARPGFGWFFGRDALYTLYAVNGFGDFALTRAELEFLIRRQRADGKIMHEYSQTANDPSVDWPSFPYMYAAADATPLFLMAIRDYYRASGDLDFLKAHREAIEKAWAFETNPANDTDHDGIYDNSQGTGWVESWPGAMPHQEIYLALLDEQASRAVASLEATLGDTAKSSAASTRASQIQAKIEQEYYDPEKGCYAFATNPQEPGKVTPNSPVDHTTTVYPAIAYWDYNPTAAESGREGAGAFRSLKQPGSNGGALAPEGSLAHPEACMEQFAGPTLDTDWGLRDVANTEPYYDGMSYHQGSVWPLFTGWAALAEYRANQPLAGEQLLMQNVDLTWAQDPGSVTELLSGDYFVPFGRSTSHQLWSSAMVITPILRGLFGISLNASSNTITVNPHLPANWDKAEVHDLHLDGKVFDLMLYRENAKVDFKKGKLQGNGELHIELRSGRNPVGEIHLRSELPNAHLVAHPRFAVAEMEIPLPAIEVDTPFSHTAPVPGSRTGQLKYLAVEYGPRSLTITVAGQPGEDTILRLVRNQLVTPVLAPLGEKERDAVSVAEFGNLDPAKTDELEPSYLRLRFPPGTGYQPLTFTLTW